MKILLTGANGFVGSHILDELRENGFDVSIFLRRTSDTRFIESHINDGVTVHYGSFDDGDSLAAALADIEIVVHCAGKTKALDEAEYYRVNEIGTRDLVRAAIGTGATRHIVLISSLAVSGPGVPSCPAQETDSPNPATIYGKSKLAAEEVVTSQDSLTWTILRPAAVYGPRDHDFLGVFRAAKRGVIPMPGGGDQALSVVYGRDVAAAVRACMESKGALGKTYHVAAEPPCTAEDLAQEIARAMSRSVRTISLPAGLVYAACVLVEALSRITRRPHVLNRQKWAELRAPGWVCATNRIREDIGFSAPTTLSNGMAATAAWYEQQGWL